MSEPVGNTPRRPDVPSNSNKAQQEQKVTATPEAEKDPAVKVVEGKIVSRKTPWFRRAGRSLIADDASSVGDYVVMNVLIPAARNLIRDMIVGSTERVLYGSAGSRTGIGSVVGASRGGNQSTMRVRYDKMADAGIPAGLSQQARARHDFNDVVAESRDDAVVVLEHLYSRIETYGVASVADFYEYVGVSGSYMDRNWGWTDLRSADIKQVRGGWLFDLPQPISLTR